MFTDPKIVQSDRLSIRSYILFYYNLKRFREYNGKKLGLPLYPNYAETVKDRNKLLSRLRYEIQKALEAGWNPTFSLSNPQKSDLPKTEEKVLSIQDSLMGALRIKLEDSISDSYKRDLRRVCDQFLLFLTAEEKHLLVGSLTASRIDQFLLQFNSSGTYYMNKRRALGVLLSAIFKSQGKASLNPIKETSKKKAKATLHNIYSPGQLKGVLGYLEEHYPNLHLCCLMAFGCFLRPHQETRLLFVKNIKKDWTQIYLSGHENKSGRIRVVPIPTYVREILVKRGIPIASPEMNLISKTDVPYNVCYFNLQWSRAKKKMIRLGLIEKNQTIYSFRHTAAVQVYQKTKDIHILQQLLGHSNMLVTLRYLRGLGELNDQQLIAAMPEL